MKSIHVLFIHGTLKHFSTKTSKFIKYWNKFYNNKFIISVLALEQYPVQKKHQPNEYESSVKEDISSIYSLTDISDFNISEKFKAINPDIVLMYDDAFLMNAAINNVCRNLNIPTMYIQHGEFIQRTVKKDDSIKVLFSKLFNYLDFLKYYIKSRKFQVNIYLKLIYKLFRMSIYNESVNPRVKISDFHCDYAAVWNEVHEKNALYDKGYKEDNIFIVGNPDGLNHFSNKLYFDPSSKNVMYIVQPLIDSNLISEKEYISWAKKISQRISEEYQLVVRPHPKSDINFLQTCFPNAIFSKDENYPLFATIGHFSTYSIKANQFVPSILMNFKQTEEYANGDVYNNLPKIDAYDFEGLFNFLSNAKKMNNYKNQELLQEFKKDFYKMTTKTILGIVKF